MKILYAAQMKSADEASAGRGVPGFDLMENVGRKVAAAAAKTPAEDPKAPVLVLCGKGNNGGDGLAAARHMRAAGIDARVLLAAEPTELKGEAAAMLASALESGVPLEVVADPDQVGRALDSPPRLVIDALFGTGFRPPMDGRAAAIINTVNASRRPVMAVDIPSGLAADSGLADGCAITARWTVVLGALKPCLVMHPAAAFAGRLILADIGHPPDLLNKSCYLNELLHAGWCRRHLRQRAAVSHKGNYGHVVVVAGSRRYPGAALLAAAGAIRGGAGLVTLAAPKPILDRATPALPEVIALPLAMDETSGMLDAGAIADILTAIQGKRAVVLGPGLGQSSGVSEIVSRLLAVCPLPMVVDADALNVLALDPRPLVNRIHATVITPHPGELARLTGVSTEAVAANRLGHAAKAAGHFGAVTVLKGHRTVVVNPQANILINISGNPGMASGGQGDVLSGLIGALLAQDLPPLAATAIGVYLHGRAGDLAAAEIGPWGFTASEVARRLPAALKSVFDGHEDIETI